MWRKPACVIPNHDDKRLDDQRYKLIVQACDEILFGKHHDMFPLHVWMTGSGDDIIKIGRTHMQAPPIVSKT